MKKVGIPRALIYYKFADLWIPFFEALGAKVIISPKTTKRIKEFAVSNSPDEDCYSTKLYFGHVMEIKDKVDYLFIPRFGGWKKDLVGCPKFIGLAETLKSMHPDLPEIIMPHFNRAKLKDTKLDFFKRAFGVGWKFTKNPFKIIKAFRIALESYKSHLQNLIIDEKTLQKWENSEIILNDFPMVNDNDRQLKIALVGHSYVLNDPFSSLSIRSILQEHGVDMITSEQMPRSIVEDQMDKLGYNLYFDYEREILGTAMYFMESKTVDGIIHLMIFSCGPDSIAGEMAARLSKRKPDIPLLQLVFDELTAEAGMKTRIEAFVDMLRRSGAEQAVFLTASVHI
ncbi:MAG: acyl-CoA dehydratase activase-related protein [Candidatus Heimdallarchaeaceae archaeon]|jgi:predicted nucleotide-binding protein (sugar kinase/HSP70/actin superfamily)